MAKKVVKQEATPEVVETAQVRKVSVNKDKVTLKPIKKHGWLPDNHDGSIRYSKCFERLTVQAMKGTGVLNTGLSEEDERRLEKKMNIQKLNIVRQKALFLKITGAQLECKNGT